MTKWSIPSTVMFTLFSTLLLGTADTLTSPLGFVPSYFSEDTEYETPAWACTVYAISHPYYPDTEIVYKWEDLRPLTRSTGETVYSVAQNRIDHTHRSIVEKAIKGWADDSPLECGEVIVPVNCMYDGCLRSFRVRKAVILLPADA